VYFSWKRCEVFEKESIRALRDGVGGGSWGESAEGGGRQKSRVGSIPLLFDAGGWREKKKLRMYRREKVGACGPLIKGFYITAQGGMTATLREDSLKGWEI